MNQPVEIERIFNVSVDQLWHALTDNETLEKWYFDFNKNFKPLEGHIVEWYAGPPEGKQWLHKAIILEVVEKEKIKHSWQYPGYDGYSELTWEIIPVSPGKTRLKLTHKFIEPFDENEKELNRKNFLEGWNYIINEALTAYLENGMD